MNNDQLYFYNRGFNDCLAKCLDTSPAKTLTDEEIKAIWHKVWHDEEGTILDFGRAILRKAQEK